METLSVGEEAPETEKRSPKDSQTAETKKNMTPNNDKQNSTNERSLLYEKGLQFKRTESYPHALQCFLGCLQDMKDNIDFPELPQCLRNIAEIYSTMGEFEKAIEFVQAEKLFYETALIQAGRKEAIEIGNKETDIELIDPDANSEEACLANEYEKLSKMCLKEKKVQLALEYAGKATQLRKKIYGDTHAITTKSLNQFTLIYAEMGKQQYSAAMAKMANKEEPAAPKPDQEPSRDEEQSRGKPDTVTERDTEEIPEEKQDDKNHDVPVEEELDVEEDRADSSGRTFFLYFLLTLLTSFVFTAAWYFLDEDINSFYSSLLNRIKFYYYYYFNYSVDGIRYI